MISHETLLLIYRRMLRIRAFEMRVGELDAAGELPGHVSLALGSEATAVGGCAPLGAGDVVFYSPPVHAPLLARDVPMGPLLAELFGRAAGTNRGRAGPRRASMLARAVLSADDAPGAAIPLAAGAALAAKRQGGGKVALAFFGAGAVASGSFHDGLTLAAALALPAIFLCESHAAEDAGGENPAGTEDVGGRADSYGIPAVSVDGSDVLAVYAAVDEAARRAREGDGPTLIAARTPRWNLSKPFPDESPLSADEGGRLERDPIERFIVYLAAHGVAGEPELARIAREVDAELTEAVEFAQNSPAPSLDELFADVYA